MNRHNAMTLALAAALAAVVGCSAKPETQASAEADATAAPAAAPVAENTFTGEVKETMEAGPYTYVRVDNGSEEIWAAASRFPVAVGDRVVVPLSMPMESFHSDSLDRDFELIYFAGQIFREGEAPAPGMLAGHPPVNAQQASAEPISVTPAEGGVTIAELWAGKDRLAGSTVVVRGKVVKFNREIMGTNWLHLQDGSGDAEAGTHDITVTTSGAAAVGDVVTVTGSAAVDKDFGFGYAYPVLIQDAEVVVED